MSFIKKAMILGGMPVRPTTKKNRYAKGSLKELKAQTKALEAQALALDAQVAAREMLARQERAG